MSSLSEAGVGCPGAPAAGCPSEVVRDQTRDKLGKGKEEIPQPLYLFVSLIAIFAYVVVYKVFHNIWSYWLGSLGEAFGGTGAVTSGRDWFLFVPSLPLQLQPCFYLDPQGLVQGQGAVFSPAPLLAHACRAGWGPECASEHRCGLGSRR